MLLSDYIKERRLTEAKFGQEIDVSQVAVHRYCAGQRTPTKEIMHRIAVATDGKVLPNDFFDVEAA